MNLALAVSEQSKMSLAEQGQDPGRRRAEERRDHILGRQVFV